MFATLVTITVIVVMFILLLRAVHAYGQRDKPHIGGQVPEADKKEEKNSREEVRRCTCQCPFMNYLRFSDETYKNDRCDHCFDISVLCCARHCHSGDAEVYVVSR